MKSKIRSLIPSIFNISTVLAATVGIAIGTLIISYYEDHCDFELAEAKDKLSRAYVIPADKFTGIRLDTIKLDSAKTLMKEFQSNYRGVDSINFEGMNINLGHIALMALYASDHPSSTNHGYRIYNGLIPASTSTVSNIVHLLFPVSDVGAADMSISDVLVYDPPSKFELPCPTLCD